MSRDIAGINGDNRERASRAFNTVTFCGAVRQLIGSLRKPLFFGLSPQDAGGYLLCCYSLDKLDS
jgi:hypothetical protein